MPRKARPRACLPFRRHRADVELRDFHRTLTESRTDAVRRRIAAADNDDVLAAGEDRIGRPADAVDVSRPTRRFCCEVRHGVVNAVEISAADTGRARGFRTAAIKHGIVVGQKRLDRHIHADIDAAMEGNAFALDLLDTAIDEVLLHLEVRNTVTQQPAGLRFTLVDMHFMTRAAKLLCGGHARGAGTDDGNFFPGVDCRRLRHDKAQLIGLVGDGLLDGLDRDRCILEVQRARLLTRRGTDAAGEFRKLLVEWRLRIASSQLLL